MDRVHINIQVSTRKRNDLELMNNVNQRETAPSPLWTNQICQLVRWMKMCWAKIQPMTNGKHQSDWPCRTQICRATKRNLLNCHWLVRFDSLCTNFTLSPLGYQSQNKLDFMKHIIFYAYRYWRIRNCLSVFESNGWVYLCD